MKRGPAVGFLVPAASRAKLGEAGGKGKGAWAGSDSWGGATDSWAGGGAAADAWAGGGGGKSGNVGHAWAPSAPPPREKGLPKGGGAWSGSGGGAGKGSGGLPPGHIAIKVLLSPKETSSILGQGGSICKEIGVQSNTKLHFSGRTEYYPGTELQELTIRGPSVEAVRASIGMALSKVVEEGGQVSGGDVDLDPTTSRVRLVVPHEVAQAVIGRGGANIKELRASTGLKLHIDPAAIGTEEFSEQVMSLVGPFEAMEVGVGSVLEKVAERAAEPWFVSWGSTSMAGSGVDIATIKGNKGCKGKGKKGPPKGAPGQAAIGDHNGWGNSNVGWSAAAASASLDMFSDAISALPPNLASPSDRSQQISLTCPAQCVGALIGKGGSVIQEIQAATGAKISIRRIEGDDQAQHVTISGNAVYVAAAYLYVAGRIGQSQDRVVVPAGGATNAVVVPPRAHVAAAAAPEFQGWGDDPSATEEADPIMAALGEGEGDAFLDAMPAS